ncbi:hypothetical protein B9Z19DRAFT_1119475 [Tuber borchii]|uniref:Myotubularin phosphatase domain-containing protein n=1 Tax=Tuber borchii TaxID=42251 RepID=A0A2T7A6K7_TUBBO|nr:hypothetical protein B9Z19DRAFT_1119475 [Tuber borchii]
MAPVEKDWVSFRHRSCDRCGFLGSDKWFIKKCGNGVSAEEGYLAFDDDPLASRNGGPGASATVANAGGGLGEALEKGFGQAKLFSNTVGVVPGRASSSASNSTELPDGAEDCPASSSLHRRAKLANTATIPATITRPGEVSPVFHQFLDQTYQILHQNPTRFDTAPSSITITRNVTARGSRTTAVAHGNTFLTRREMWINEKYDPAADGADMEREIGGERVCPRRPAQQSDEFMVGVWGEEGEGEA